MNDFLKYKFPDPQYLGAKHVHREWIRQFIPSDSSVTLDAFGGLQSIAYLFKQLGKRVITNDFMSFNNEIGKALIENTNVTLSEKDMKLLFGPNSNPAEYNLIETLFSDLFFTREEASFVDAFRSNIPLFEDRYKQAMALAVMCRSMTRKVTMGHFAHTKTLEYAADSKRVSRNRSLTRPLREIFMELLPLYNALVFDNKTKRYESKRHSGFDKISEAIESLRLMFERSQHIPTWLVSYNDRSYPDIETMVKLIRLYKEVKIEKKVYDTGRGGKGSVASSSEVLLICTSRN